MVLAGYVIAIKIGCRGVKEGNVKSSKITRINYRRPPFFLLYSREDLLNKVLSLHTKSKRRLLQTGNFKNQNLELVQGLGVPIVVQ